MDQTGPVGSNQKTEQIFQTKNIYKDSFSDSLEMKTFNFTMAKNIPSEPSEEVSLQKEPVGQPEEPEIDAAYENFIKLIDDLKDNLEIEGQDLECLGDMVSEVVSPPADRLKYYHFTKPRLKYEEYVVKRLKMTLKKLEFTPENRQKLDNLGQDDQPSDIDLMKKAAELQIKKYYHNIYSKVVEKYTKEMEGSLIFSIPAVIDALTIKRGEKQQDLQARLKKYL